MSESGSPEERIAPDSLADMDESVVMNPEAIGDPDATPVVFVGAGLRALLNPCACGGVNGFHGDGCADVQPNDRVQECPGVAGCWLEAGGWPHLHRVTAAGNWYVTTATGEVES